MPKHTAKHSPAVSVVVPVYNTGEYLPQCLDSILHQTLKNIEIIVINDGSTDNSPKILDRYAQKHSKIKVIHKKNGGVGSAYNMGLKLATGEYVGFIDSDDWIEPNMYHYLFAKAQKYHPDVVKSNSFWTHNQNIKKKRITIPPALCSRVIKNNLNIPQFVIGHISHWTGIYKRDFLTKRNIGFYDLDKSIAPDIDFIFRVWLKAKSFYIISKPFVHYRLDRPTSDRQSGAKMSFSLLKTHILIRDYFKQEQISPAYWYIKTYAEFHHLEFELHQRCLTRRTEFIQSLSNLFWDNLTDNHICQSYFSKKELFLYHTIACLPFLYKWNDKYHFWIQHPGLNGTIINDYLFGLIRHISYGRLSQQLSPSPYWKALGINVLKNYT